MVRIEKNKLSIEIETSNPTGDLEVYQNALIDVLSFFDYDTHDKGITLPVFSLLQQTFSASKHPDKLIIEFETEEPKEILKYWQNGINDVLTIHDSETIGSNMINPLFELLRQTTKVIFNTKK
jgi:hypothetical protein